MAGAMAGGAAIGAGIEATGQAIGMVLQKKAARKSRQHQIRLMKMRHQWEASDLEAAGLNRILSVTGKASGGGVSAPMANIQSPRGVAQAGIQGALLAAQLKQIQATTAKTIAEGQIVRAGVPTAEVKEGLLRWFYDQVRSSIGTSARELLSPEAKKAFGMIPEESPRSMTDKHLGGAPIRVHKFEKRKK